MQLPPFFSGKIFTKNNALIGMAILLFLLIFFHPEKRVTVEVPVPTKEIDRQLVKDTIAIKKVVDSMKIQQSKLKDSLKETKIDLKAASELVVELLNDASVIIDSSSKEELHQQLDYLKAAVQLKDSLCNSAISISGNLVSNLESQLSQKDSLAAVLRSSYTAVKYNEQLKDGQIKALNKQLRNNKLKKNGWKIGAGAAVIYIIAKSLN